MKKSLISLTMIAGMAVSGAAIAAEVTPYARIHMSLDSWDDDQNGFSSANVTAAALAGLGLSAAEAAKLVDILGAPNTGDDLDLASRKSVFGVKGSQDAGSGHKVFYKLEWEVQPDSSAGSGFSSGRDQYIGYKFGQGSVKIGTMTNNYKQMGGKMDKLWHTGLEGRGFLNMMSRAHAGKGVNGGRQTDTVQYSSPKMGGMQLVVNRTFSNDSAGASTSTDETSGVGFRIAKKKWMAFFDWIDMICDPDSGQTGIATCQASGTESGFKVGGKGKFGKFEVAAQIEDVSDIKTAGTGPLLTNTDIGEYTYVQGAFNMDKNNTIVLTYGAEGDVSTGTVLAYIHKTGAKSKVYVGWGSRSDDIPGNSGATATLNEQQLISAGWSASFM